MGEDEKLRIAKEALEKIKDFESYIHRPCPPGYSYNTAKEALKKINGGLDK